MIGKELYAQEVALVRSTEEILTFPEDFILRSHPLGQGLQWVDNLENITISIVGGSKGLYGDGITTFEMWDFREENPRGYLSTEDINEHLSNNPIT
jgi:hypothetical protein